MSVYVVFNKKGIQRICSKVESAEKWANVLDCGSYEEHDIDDEFPYPDGACYAVYIWNMVDFYAYKTHPDLNHPVMTKLEDYTYCRVWALSKEEATKKAMDMFNKGAAG